MGKVIDAHIKAAKLKNTGWATIDAVVQLVVVAAEDGIDCYRQEEKHSGQLSIFPLRTVAYVRCRYVIRLNMHECVAPQEAAGRR